MKIYFRNSIFICAAIVLFLAGLNLLLGWTIGGDSEWYIAASEGKWKSLIEPYSARILHPFLVGVISRAFSVEVYPVFLLIAVLSLFLFFFLNSLILEKIISTPILLAPLFVLPYFFATIREIFQPDAFYIFLTAIFFLLLYLEKEFLSLGLIFLLYLARESTMLLGGIFALTSWFKSKRLLAISIIAILLASMVLVGFLSRGAGSNIHHLSGPVYMVFKLSYNFLSNVFGIRAWANTYTSCSPLYKFALPEMKIFGFIKEIGFCGFDFLLPLKTLIALLSTFGILPLILIFLLSRNFKEILKSPFWLLLALIYGLAHYFIAIPAGTGVVRLVGYAWTAFILATPFLMKQFMQIEESVFKKLIAVHFVVAWLPLIFQKLWGDTILVASGTLFLIIIFYLKSFLFLKKHAV